MEIDTEIDSVVDDLALEEDVKRRIHLVNRQIELRKQLNVAAVRETKLRAALVTAREVRRETGEAGDDLAQLRAQLREQHDDNGEVADSLVQVTEELEQVQQRIAAVEHEREKLRQGDVAEPLRIEAQECIAGFAEAFAGLTAPLLRRAAILKTLALDCPLARPLESVRLDDITKSVIARMRWDPVQDWLFASALVARILGGPRGDLWAKARPRVPAERLRELGITP